MAPPRREQDAHRAAKGLKAKALRLKATPESDNARCGRRDRFECKEMHRSFSIPSCPKVAFDVIQLLQTGAAESHTRSCGVGRDR